MSPLVVLAIGGNSLIVDPKKRDVGAQYHNCLETCKHIANLLRSGCRVVLTHGNGPQVGFILRRSELAMSELHHVPLDMCVADTQGSIGYMLQRAMRYWTKDWEQPLPVYTLVTQVIVDKDDPAFTHPSKPIGSFMTEEEAEERKKEGWQVMEDSNRGYRRVVPSPKPLKIIEIPAIKTLLDTGALVVAAGGGGLPVVLMPDGRYVGKEAVVDKDHASALLAKELGADYLVVSTGVEKVAIRFGQPDQKWLDRITVSQAKKYLQEKHFGVGSMEPKIQAAIDFIESGGKATIITDPTHLELALKGEAGTWIVSDEEGAS